MIDPHNITKYDRTQGELQEFLLFCILVAGKRADITARNLQFLLDYTLFENSFFSTKYDPQTHSAFVVLSESDKNKSTLLKEFGFGCYNIKGASVTDIINLWMCGEFDLRSPYPEDYEQIIGIGPKTSRFYILHTQQDANCAPLDTHALKFLKHHGVAVPASTPQSKKKYKELEAAYIALCPPNKTLAQFDLEVWRKYTVSKEVVK